MLHVSKLTLHDALSVCASLTGDLCTVKKEVDVCKRRDSGTHSLKVSSERKVLKKVGQVEVVKLFPRPVSKGLGSASEEPEVAVEMDEAEEDVDVERSARLIRCISGSGGVLRSKRRILSLLVRACDACSS